MKDRDEFWDHVNAALDERRDPFADPRVQRAVLEQSELLFELERLDRRLTFAGSPARRGSLALTLTAAALLVAIGAWALRPERRAESARVAESPVPSARVLSSRISFTHADVHGTRTTTLAGSARTSSFVARDGSRTEHTTLLQLTNLTEKQP